MPIMHVRQPEFLPVGDNLRLRRLDGSVDFGRDWRRDLQALLLEDGKAPSPAFEDLRQLYARLNDRMEVYGMEARSGSGFSPVGVAAFCQENMLVFIGDCQNRRQGMGRQVVSAFLRRGRSLGYGYLEVRGLSRYGVAARRLLESLGFHPRPAAEDEIYRLDFPDTGVELRPYRPQDCASLIELFRDTVYGVCAKDYTQAQREAWVGGVEPEVWNRSFLEHDTLVAWAGNLPAGFGDMDETGYLDRLYVGRDFQRRGIARALCDALEARQGGPVFTTHASRTARGFFEARGYRVLQAQQVERRGQYLENFVMRKEREETLW